MKTLFIYIAITKKKKKRLEPVLNGYWRAFLSGQTKSNLPLVMIWIIQWVGNFQYFYPQIQENNQLGGQLSILSAVNPNNRFSLET